MEFRDARFELLNAYGTYWFYMVFNYGVSKGGEVINFEFHEHISN